MKKNIKNRVHGPNSNPAQIQSYLAGLSYPVSKMDVIEYAEISGAPDAALAILSAIADRDYESPGDLMDEITSGEDL